MEWNIEISITEIWDISSFLFYSTVPLFPSQGIKKQYNLIYGIKNDFLKN
jgi:hypothetical protein